MEFEFHWGYVIFFPLGFLFLFALRHLVFTWFWTEPQYPGAEADNLDRQMWEDATEVRSMAKQYSLLFLLAVIVLLPIALVFMGVGWSAGSDNVSVEAEIPREESRIQYREQLRPDVSEQGRDIQKEAKESLDQFREDF